MTGLSRRERRVRVRAVRRAMARQQRAGEHWLKRMKRERDESDDHDD